MAYQELLSKDPLSLFLILVSLLLIILGSISHSKCDNANGKRSAMGVVIIGVILLIGFGTRALHIS